MAPDPDHPERMPSEPTAAPAPSEDELARMMIERIARQVDLETGRVPLVDETEAEPADDGDSASLADEADAAEEPEEAPAERSEEDVSRDLIERIAREVDEEAHG
jgi:hypothetical protein